MFTLARFSEAFLILKAQETGVAVALVPAVMVLMNVVYALSAYPAGALSDRLGRNGVLLAGFSLLIAADLLLAFAPGWGVLLLAVALWGLHMGLTQGVLASMVADTAPADLRGTAFGLFNLAGGIAMLIASVLAGWLWDVYGSQTTFLAGAAFTAVAIVTLVARRRP